MTLAVVTFWDVVWWIIIATFAVLFSGSSSRCLQTCSDGAIFPEG